MTIGVYSPNDWWKYSIVNYRLLCRLIDISQLRDPRRSPPLVAHSCVCCCPKSMQTVLSQEVINEQ